METANPDSETSSRIEEVRASLRDGRWHKASSILLADDSDRLKRAQLMLRYGLNEAARADIDALHNGGHQSSDLVLAEAMATLLAYGKPEVAAEAVERILALEGLAGDQRGRALQIRALAAHRMDRWETALRDLVMALDIAKSLGDVELRTDVLKAMASVETWRGQHSQALLHLTLAVADCAGVGDRFMLSELLGDCGRLNLEMRRYSHALDFFNKQEEIARTWLVGRSRLRLDLDMARALTGLRRHAEALSILGNLEESARTAGFEYLVVMASHCRGRIHLQEGEPGACLHVIEPLLATGRVDPESYECAALQSLVSEAGLMLNDHLAKRKAIEVIDFYHARRLVAPEVEARLNLANRLADIGGAQAAADLLRVALARCRTADMDLLERKVREALVRLDRPVALEEELDRRLSNGLDHHEGNGYILIEKLGSGSFATVFRAYDIERDRDVAFKRFVHPGEIAPDLWQTFEKSARAELKIAARVRHAGIAHVLAIGTEADGHFYTVQDFIPGPTLRAVMRARCEPVFACRVARDLASTLAALHQLGITHRDIKPENVICALTGKPVILDLGIAAISASGQATIGRGTPAYAAPEQWAGDLQGPPADVFPLGIILHEWLLGRMPDEKPSSFLDIFSDRKRIRVADRDSLASKGLKNLGDLVESMISRDPEKRPSCLQIVAGLTEIIDILDKRDDIALERRNEPEN